MAVQETHLQGTEIRHIRSSDGKNKYELFYTGAENNSHHGVAIVTEIELKPQYQRISNRISKMTTKLNVKDGSRELVFISAYAPTLVNSEKDPKLREEFYEQLDNAIFKTNSRSLLIVAGDFNAKTGSAYKQYPENMGAFGKGELNSNGEHLLDICRKNELVITNTLFYHKMCHRTTWTCPEKKQTHLDKNGSIRKNPYRNQIDYIIVKNKHKPLIQNARSYSGTNTDTDHRLVMTTLNLEWYKAYQIRAVKYNVDINKLQTPEYRNQYKTYVSDSYSQRTEEKSPQDQWDNIKNACLEAAEKTLGTTKNQTRSENPEIKILSEKQKKIRNDINCSQNKKTIEKLKKERNQILREIHSKLEEEVLQKINSLTEEIEVTKNDSTRTYKAIRALNSLQPKKQLVIEVPETKEITTNEKKQNQIITDFFNKIFHQDNEAEIPDIKPCKMKKPFTEKEITSAIKSLKNNKSAGCDEIRAELLKHSPSEIHKNIAQLLNNIAKTGEYPQEVKRGILVPLPKPGKPQGPPKNLRPIILLSMLRKIIAICMIRRTMSKLNENIPITQAAYREGRSTTEHVYTFKTLGGKSHNIKSNSETFTGVYF